MATLKDRTRERAHNTNRGRSSSSSKTTTSKTSSTSTHPEAPTADDPTTDLVGEAEFSVQDQILDSRIRSERLGAKREVLRGVQQVRRQKKLWADTQEVKADQQGVKLGMAQDKLTHLQDLRIVKKDQNEEKLGIEQDNLKGLQGYRAINRSEIVATLANKSYKVDAKQNQNTGLRQALLNDGKQPSMDHLADLNQVTVDVEGMKVTTGGSN